MSKLNYHYSYYFVRPNLDELETAVDTFLFEADKLIPISYAFGSLKNPMKARYLAAVEEVRQWLSSTRQLLAQATEKDSKEKRNEK